MIIIDHQQHVGPLVLQPGADRDIGVEDRLPGRIVLLAGVERETDSGGMGTGDRADQGSHVNVLRTDGPAGWRRARMRAIRLS